MPYSYHEQVNIILLYNYIPNCKIILLKFLVLRNQLQDWGYFWRGTKALVIGITQRKGDQQFITCKAEELFQKSWEAGHRHVRLQFQIREQRAVLQMINVHDTNLHSLAYNSVLKFYLLQSINTRTLLTINIQLSRSSRFVYSRK